MGMRRLKPGAPLDRSAGADLFRHTLSRIPSVFGRLLYLASLRDPNTGVYHHHGFTAAFGKEQSRQALILSHKRTFREWMRLKFKEKHADLVTYLETLDDPKGLVVSYWLESQGYLTCVPDDASKADRAYYESDLKLLLESLRDAAGGGPARGSSRRR